MVSAKPMKYFQDDWDEADERGDEDELDKINQYWLQNCGASVAEDEENPLAVMENVLTELGAKIKQNKHLGNFEIQLPEGDRIKKNIANKVEDGDNSRGKKAPGFKTSTTKWLADNGAEAEAQVVKTIKELGGHVVSNDDYTFLSATPMKYSQKDLETAQEEAESAGFEGPAFEKLSDMIQHLMSTSQSVVSGDIHNHPAEQASEVLKELGVEVKQEKGDFFLKY